MEEIGIPWSKVSWIGNLQIVVVMGLLFAELYSWSAKGLLEGPTLEWFGTHYMLKTWSCIAEVTPWSVLADRLRIAPFCFLRTPEWCIEIFYGKLRLVSRLCWKSFGLESSGGQDKDPEFKEWFFSFPSWPISLVCYSISVGWDILALVPDFGEDCSPRDRWGYKEDLENV